MSPALGLGNLPLQQAVVFAGAAVLGLGLGLLYDLLRLLRLGRGSRVWAAVWDLLFWCAVGTSALLYAAATGGEVQVYALCAQALGALAYFLLLSPAVRWAEDWLERGGRWIWGLLVRPLRFFGAQAKKLWIFFKKLFSFWKRWFTIIGKLGAKFVPPGRRT